MAAHLGIPGIKHKFKDIKGVISDAQHGTKTTIPNAHHTPKKLRELISELDLHIYDVWYSHDAYTVDLGVGAEAPFGLGIQMLKTGVVAGSHALIRPTLFVLSGGNISPYWLWQTFFDTRVCTFNSTVWFIIGRTNNDVGDLVEHIGFKIVDGRLFCSNCGNVANQTITDTEIDLGFNVEYRLSVRFRDDVGEAKFYLGEDVVATHTTNLYNIGYNCPKWYITPTADAQREVLIKSWLLQMHKSQIFW